MRSLLFSISLFALAVAFGCTGTVPTTGEPVVYVPAGAPGVNDVVTSSASASTIYAFWTSSRPSRTTLACGLSPAIHDINAVDNGTQSNVTRHAGIVAGLMPSTTYYCQATGDKTLQFSLTTLAPPPGRPLTGVTFGTPENPVPNQNNGDVYNNAVGANGVTYVTTNDSPHGWTPNGLSSNMMVGRFVGASPLTGANVNQFSNFGTWASCIGPDKRTPKISGIFAYNRELYVAYSRILGGECPGFPASPPGTALGFDAAIFRSVDYGLSWSNFQSPDHFDRNAAALDPVTANMFAGSSACGEVTFVMYGADNGTTLPTYRVDNADAYLYMMCANRNYVDGADDLNMARIPLASLATLDRDKIQYFIGGPAGNGVDGSLDGAWSSSPMRQASILHNPGRIDVPTVQYMPATGRYLLMTTYRDNPAVIPNTTWQTYEAPHPWGPWALIDTTTWSKCGWYLQTIYLPSALTATANGKPMTVLMAGDYTDNACYQLWTVSMVANTHR